MNALPQRINWFQNHSNVNNDGELYSNNNKCRRNSKAVHLNAHWTFNFISILSICVPLFIIRFRASHLICHLIIIRHHLVVYFQRYRKMSTVSTLCFYITCPEFQPMIYWQNWQRCVYVGHLQASTPSLWNGRKKTHCRCFECTVTVCDSVCTTSNIDN